MMYIVRKGKYGGALKYGPGKYAFRAKRIRHLYFIGFKK